MPPQDISWVQRFEHYNKALGQLRKFMEHGELNEFEEQGLIQAFEYTHELAWNTMKDFFEDQGEAGILGSRDAIRLAFKRGLIEDGETWMETIKSRTLTSQSYNEEIAVIITAEIINKYYAAFVALQCRLNTLKHGEWKEEYLTADARG